MELTWYNFDEMKNWTHKNFTIHQFESLESSNKTAFAMAEAKQIFDREVILAEMQTGGKGRESRVWSSPQGNLYFSLVLQPKILAVKIPQISFVAIVALRQVVQELLPNHKIENKWPNDLLIEQKKVAGLLLESKISGENVEFVIVGIGLNLVSNPDQTIFPASNLKNFGAEVLPEIVLKKFLNEFEKLYENYLNFGFAAVRRAWISAAFRLNEKISVKNGEEEILGIFSNLDEEGNLILITENGDKKTILAADIF